jgi:DNA-binding MarR family transcriptional regulator
MSPTKKDLVADAAAALRRHAMFLRTLHRKVLQGSLSPAQAAVLQFISEQGRTTPSDLAQFTGLTAGSITSVLDGLEEAGYLARTRSTEDRRVVWVTLSERAASLLDELVKEAHQEFARLFRDWTPDDIQKFTGFLDRLIRAPPLEAS